MDRTLDAREVALAGGPLDAVVHVPGSKSIANRALICATLADGTSTLTNVPGGDDTAAMLDCVALLGAGVDVSDGSTSTAAVPADQLAADRLAADRLTIVGTGGALRPGPLTLHARLAGTTSRFVTALCALGIGSYDVDGLAPLRSRPMGPLHDALAALGAGVEAAESAGHLPVRITAIDRVETDGDRRTVRIAGDISSQYITAVMLIAPYLPGGVRIELTTPLVSRPYVAITAAVMAAFGVPDVEITPNAIVVGPGAYVARDYVIEPDASSASYPLAAAAVCGGTVRVDGLGTGSLQGDAAFADVLARMGCDVTRDATSTVVTRTGDLVGLTIDMGDLSDLVPTLAVVAAFASTSTEITGVGFIRAKESDRLGDLAAEMRRCGIVATDTADGLRIEPGHGHGAALATHHDHRLAMAFGVLGLGLGDVTVLDPSVVSKSWPDFWDVLESLRPDVSAERGAAS